jgi:Asp-tRNA(Asn)/Glu-tRNA(Gln) amidotransferase A subunit family amidase
MSETISAAPLPGAEDNPTRRDLLHALAAAGIGTPVFQRALSAAADEPAAITPAQILEAEWISGLILSEADRKAVARILTRWQRGFAKLRKVKLDNSVPLPLVFNPAPELPPGQRTGKVEPTTSAAPKKPDAEDDLAFLPLTSLAALVRTRKVSSVELTKLYLARLEKYDPALHCVVTLTEKTALAQARAADQEIAAGRYRGVLHGIPWGAKDLIAYPGYPTTWGAEPYKKQTLTTKATVARRLDEAGAVLVAKLSLGALASGDQWFGNRQTRNPWDPSSGSSGSSAGSASATAAGLVGFAIGSETLGSIVSPSRVCGTSGLRPTFGRVSRHGCMTLSWSMDKIGPIARSIEDCALIFGAIHGRDGLDASAVNRPFSWPSRRKLDTLKVGYVEKTANKRALKVLREEIGVELVAIELPSKYLFPELNTILYAEAAAVFEDLTREGKVKEVERWKPLFQAGQFVSASDYLRANRVRALIMQQMQEVMEKVDLYVADGDDLLLANLTGHPTIVMPNGFVRKGKVEVPTAITFTGRLFGETELLAVGHAYQQATRFHLRRPRMDRLQKGAKGS